MKTTNKTETITIRCTPHQKRKIQKIAKAFEMTMSEFCLALTRVYFVSGRDNGKCVTQKGIK